MKMTPESRQDLIGMGWMLLVGLCFAFVNAIVRGLDGSLPAAEGAFIRFVFGVVFLIPLIMRIDFGSITARQWRMIGLRGSLHVIAVICWFYAMSRIALAEVTAIGFLNPIFVTIGGAIVFREKLAARRITAIAVALIGALIVLRPGLRPLELGHFAQIMAAVAFGLSYLVAKRLSSELPATLVVAMLSVSVTIGLFPLAVAVWVWPTWLDLAGLALVAAIATFAHYAMTRAFAAAPLTVTQPVTFLQLLWATLLGVFLFGDPLDVWVIIGGAIMIGAISYITWREARRRPEPMTPAMNQAKA